ncbi:hypothetical protein FOZ60_016788 [Perkinsus olseni]|uniref:RRM domain-containing protein n=1 Tax=Perkinsus olseni TaxID=32597 RepID=A0A7J6P3Z5_PEROL|nr:hypothetical protein FOZ60_016788 [Perkinsus olseni]
MSAFSRPDDLRQQQQPPAFHSSLAYGNAEDRKVQLEGWGMGLLRIFMGGLPQEIDKQYIDAYFSQFGAIEDSIVMVDRATGRSRGFGFITFLQPQDMEACLANGPHVVMEKVIDVKRAADGKKQHTPASAGPVPRGRGMMISRPDPDRYGHFHRQSVMDDHPGQVVADDPRKVFIGGIPVSGDRGKLIALLSRYGNVIDCDIMYDKETGRNKGFGRATFSTPEEADAAMRGGERNMIDAKCVDIKPLLRPSDASHNNSAHGTHHQPHYQRRDSFTSDPADASCKLFLGGIPQSADEDKLAHHLTRYGRVVDVRIYQDLETGRHKGFGYAVMGTPMEAQAACNGGNNNYIDAKWVQIKPFCSPTPHDRYPRNPQQQQAPTPPPPAGGAPPPPPPPPSSVNATGLPLGGLVLSVYASNVYKLMAIDMHRGLPRSHAPHVIMDKTIDVKRAVEGGLGPRVTRHRQQGPMKAAWTNSDNIYYYGGSSRGGGSYRGYSGGKWSTSSSYTLPYRVPDDPSKVFIGGLPASADEDSLTDMLGQYGNIVDCNVMFDRGTGRNRGFGYATFSTPAEANAACRGGDSNVMDGKWVEVKPCTRLEFPTSTPPPPTTTNTETFKPTSGAVYGSYQQQRGAYSTQQAQKQQQQPKLPDNPCKVFLGGLPQSADQDRVTEHLSQYGNVLDVTVMYDRDTGRHRGFAYATFSNNEEAQAAINGNSNNVIDGKWEPLSSSSSSRVGRLYYCKVQVKPSSRSMEHVGKAFQVIQQQQQQGSGGGHYRNGGSSSSNTSPRTGAYYQSQQQRHHQQQRTSPSPSPYRRPGGRSSDTYTTGYTSGKRRDDKQERTLVGYSRYQSSLRPKDQPDHHGTSDDGDDEDQQHQEQHEAQPQLRQQEPPPPQQQLSPHRQEEETVVEDRKSMMPPPPTTTGPVYSGGLPMGTGTTANTVAFYQHHQGYRAPPTFVPMPPPPPSYPPQQAPPPGMIPASAVLSQQPPPQQHQYPFNQQQHITSQHVQRLTPTTSFPCPPVAPMSTPPPSSSMGGGAGFGFVPPMGMFGRFPPQYMQQQQQQQEQQQQQQQFQQQQMAAQQYRSGPY